MEDGGSCVAFNVNNAFNALGMRIKKLIGRGRKKGRILFGNNKDGKDIGNVNFKSIEMKIRPITEEKNAPPVYDVNDYDR